MTHNLVICRFLEQRYMILNLCTFLRHPVYIMEVGDNLNPQRSLRKGFALKGI